ncbi:MAG TPA: YggS family pyridoxal phosphate-dependent enzyme [Acidimicrobiia bacterium]|nr:YggS family pyridoxal phosphate-dependent enzyme [Acidimicrobiia bacterium]
MSRSDAETIAANVDAVRARIADAARRAGRDPAGVRLVAATKTVPAARLRAALDAGVVDLGENRAQELLAKAPELAAGPGAPRWHFLGGLQRNKVRALAPWVVCWQSVDRPELGPVLARYAPGATVLVEVNLAGEPQKSGCAPDAAAALRDALAGHGLAVAGLMAVPPVHDNSRPWFAALRELGSRLGLAELSMGMTDDFEVAVEEGATIVRVGRALFGERNQVARPGR